MTARTNLKIVIVSAFYSEGMGYSENCLSKALANLGHEVHVVTSTYNVYANEALYDKTYREFLGPGKVHPHSKQIDGYTVHRLPSTLFRGYVYIEGLARKVRGLTPDIVHSLEIASLPTFVLAAHTPLSRFKLFAETHQTLSVLRPYLRDPDGPWTKRLAYRLTRTLPTFLASLSVQTCYAVTPDCAEVAARFYGVPESKIRLLSLGADTDTFHPVSNQCEAAARRDLRESLGYKDDDIVCVYTGRFTADKNPLCLAKAISILSADEPQFKGLFIGNGVQKEQILVCKNVTVLPFMTHEKLAAHYRAADIGIWPRQESMSMIDAAASGLPLVVSDKIGEPGRVKGNGKLYAENDPANLADVLRTFNDSNARKVYGQLGRQKMMDGFNWATFAKSLEHDFVSAFAGRPPSREQRSREQC